MDDVYWFLFEFVPWWVWLGIAALCFGTIGWLLRGEGDDY